MKLKHSEVKPLREKLWAEQQGQCPLCKGHIEPQDAVLDHNHKTGQIRGTIHRNCNLYISKLENNLVRNRITPDMLVNILANFIEYVQREQGIRHPTHKTPEERKLAYKKKKGKMPKPGKGKY